MGKYGLHGSPEDWRQGIRARPSERACRCVLFNHRVPDRDQNQPPLHWQPGVWCPGDLVWSSQSSPETQKQYVCINMYIHIKEVYYKKLAHMIMELRKSPDLPPASWRLGRAAGAVPGWVLAGSRPGKPGLSSESEAGNSPRPRPQVVRREESCLGKTQLFVLS